MTFFNAKQRGRQGGYNLLEMAVVLTVAGIMTLSGIRLVGERLEVARAERVSSKLDDHVAALHRAYLEYQGGATNAEIGDWASVDFNANLVQFGEGEFQTSLVGNPAHPRITVRSDAGDDGVEFMQRVQDRFGSSMTRDAVSDEWHIDLPATGVDDFLRLAVDQAVDEALDEVVSGDVGFIDGAAPTAEELANPDYDPADAKWRKKDILNAGTIAADTLAAERTVFSDPATGKKSAVDYTSAKILASARGLSCSGTKLRISNGRFHCAPPPQARQPTAIGGGGKAAAAAAGGSRCNPRDQRCYYALDSRTGKIVTRREQGRRGG